MKYRAKKQTRQERPKNEPKLIRKVMQEVADNPDFILYNILKMKKA